MNRKKKITAAMIAKEAGVSAATMSRYINRRNEVNAKSARKIEEAMKALGLANQPAAPAEQRRAPIIVANIPALSNNFYQEVIRGIRTSAEMHGYRVLLQESWLGAGSGDVFCRLLSDIHAAGTILLSSAPQETLDAIRSVAPLVQCSEYNREAGYPYVSINDRAAAFHATQHLIDCGCNKIALINSSLRFRYARDRQEGFLEAMEQAENFVPKKWILHLPEVDYNLSYTAVCHLLNEEERPNAFFAVSDIYAVSVLRAANRYGLRIPDELMVVGFDNLDITSMTCPSVTSVAQPSYQQGYSACELLTEMIEDPQAAPRPILLDTELVIRESTSNCQAL